jgi:hypothetical protein
MINKHTLKALVQNYDFKKAEHNKLPTIDFLYPDYTADGNTEAYRFSSTLRAELAERTPLVREAFQGKDLAWTYNDATLQEIDSIAPRLGIDEIISGRINSIYSIGAPILFVGASDSSFQAYVVKPIVDGHMAWFEFTSQEKCGVSDLLARKAAEKPYRTWTQRVFGGLRR